MQQNEATLSTREAISRDHDSSLSHRFCQNVRFLALFSWIEPVGLFPGRSVEEESTSLIGWYGVVVSEENTGFPVDAVICGRGLFNRLACITVVG